MPITEPPAPLAALAPRFLAYGLGFNLRDYRGRKLVTHTGGLSGMVSRVALVPEENLAIVVLTNQESGAGRDAIAYRVLDAFLGAPATDWIPAFKEAARLGEEQARAVEAGHKAARATTSKPSLPLAAYAGRYRDAWYGEATIEVGRRSPRPALQPVAVPHRRPSNIGTTTRSSPAGATAPCPTPSSPSPCGRTGRSTRSRWRPFSPAADFSYDYQDLLFRPVREK